MQKDSAQKLIQKTLQGSFNKEQFVYFIKNILNKIDETKAFHARGYVKEKFKQQAEVIKTYERIGTFISSEDKKIDVLVVYLQKEGTIDRARTTLRNFVADYLKSRDQKDAALVAFVSPNNDDWRFSLVKMEYNFNDKGKVEEEFTPARRYSFLVGKHENSHTAQSRLLPLLLDDEVNPTLKELEDVFSVEKVTKEFFEKYRDLFLKLQESLDEIVKKDKNLKEDFKTKDINTIDFTKKLLGQIVFLYFLQKKGWFGVERDKKWGSGSKNFLRELFEKKHGDYKNFFNEILEPLFYEALRLERTGDYYSRFDCRIPFLNGGLFDPLNDYNWVDIDIELSDEIFSNDIKTKEGDVGSGILDIFDRYNFTVKEDEPLEKEVAVDPEMLGKVFENLLEVKDRRSKGTYYTPREIVHYMCQQSLINYLYTEINQGLFVPEEEREQLKLVGKSDPKQMKLIGKRKAQKEIVSKEDIETLIKYGESVVEHDSRVINEGHETKSYSFKLPPSVRKYAKEIDDKLASIRVCDPAVGSGAFPVGMMNEIIRTRNALTPYINGDLSAEALAKAGRTPYNFKRHAIQNCLYGVDIDAGAVEIAKLRLWLSLVVEEEERTTIQPLPNLDYKIVQGNSLLGVQKKHESGTPNMFYQEKIQKLHQLKQFYFNETSASKKYEYQKQIDELIIQITNGHKDFDFEVYFSEVFHEKKGFDVIIANPPYVGEKGHKDIFQEVKKKSWLSEFYQGKMDIFYFFFHLALNLSHKNSDIAFITTNYYIMAYGATKLRQDFKRRTLVRYLINFNELKIFESAQGQHNMITILQKGQDENAVSKTSITQRKGVAKPEILQQILNGDDLETLYYQVNQKDLYDGEECYIRLSGNSGVSENPIQRILDRVKKQGQLLSTICNINTGVQTGADKVTSKHIERHDINANIGDGIFVLSDKEVEKLKLSIYENGLLKPWFKNSDVLKWNTNNLSDEKILYIGRSQKTIGNGINKHLIQFKNVLSKRREVESGVIEWWQLQWPRDKQIFESVKIVAPQRSYLNTFGYNETSWYASADVYIITEKNKDLSLKYILAFLNSKLYYLWLYHRGKRKGEMLELYQIPLSEIPIKKISEDDQKPFIEIVDKILAITKEDDYLENQEKQDKVKDYEKQIDQLVYKLYDLIPEEIKIIEESQW